MSNADITNWNPMIKATFTTTALIVCTLFISYGQKAPGEVNTFYEKAVFIEANPSTPYRHIGSVECAIVAPDKFDLMMKHMITKRVPDEYPEVEFDAIIFRPNTGFRKADVVKFYTPEDAPKLDKEVLINPDFLKSETIARNGINLFIENAPTCEHTVLGKIELPQNFTSIEYQKILSEMIKTCKNYYPNMNGIVFVPGSGLTKATVIKI